MHRLNHGAGLDVEQRSRSCRAKQRTVTQALSNPARPPGSPGPSVPAGRSDSRARTRTRSSVAISLPNNAPLTSLHSWRQIKSLISTHEASLAQDQIHALLARLAIVARKQRPESGHLAEYRQFLREALKICCQHLSSYNAVALPSLMLIIAKLDFPDPEIAGILGEAVVRQLASFTPSGLAITTWSLAKLKWQPDTATLDKIMASSAELLTRCSGRDLANISWALAKMGAQPNDEWMDTFLAATELKLPLMISQDFSNILWSVAKLGGKGRAPADWVDGFLAASTEQLKMFKPQELSNMIWALMVLGHQPNPEWLKAFTVTMGDSRTLSAAAPQALANTFHALAHLQVPLKGEWLDDILSITVSSLPSFNAKDLTNMAWALATLRHNPPPTWRAVFHSVSAEKLRSCSSANLAIILWSLAKIQERPPREWVSKFFHITASPSRLAKFSPRDVANTTWALATMQIPLPSFWVEALCSATSSQLSTYSNQDLANVCWALGHSQAKPTAQWLRALMAELQQRAEAMPPDYVCMTLRGLGGIAVPIPEPPIREFVGAICHRLPTFDNQQLVSFVVGVSQAGLRLQGEWGDIILFKANKRLNTFEGEQLAELLVALAVMGSRPQPHLLDTLLRSTLSNMRQLSANALCTTVFSLSKLGHLPSQDWVAAFLPAAAAHLPECSPRDLSRLLAGLASVEAAPHSEQLRQVVAQVLAIMQPRLKEFNCHDLTAVVLAVCRLDVELPEGWLGSFLEAVVPRFTDARPWELANMMWALGTLQADTSEVRWLHSYLNAAYQKLDDFGAGDLAHLAWGLGQLGVKPSGDFMFRYLEVVNSGLNNPRWGSKRDLATIHESLVKIGDNGFVWS